MDLEMARALAQRLHRGYGVTCWPEDRGGDIILVWEGVPNGPIPSLYERVPVYHVQSKFLTHKYGPAI